MALLEVYTTNTLPSYQQSAVLDGTTYVISLYFNPVINDGVGKWMISIADQNSNLLVAPVPVIANWTLFDRFVELLDLPGSLFCFDTSGQDLDPGQFDLGDRCRLYYLEAGTIE